MGQGGGAASQVGLRCPSRVRLWRDFSQTLCSPERWAPAACLSCRESRSLPTSRSPSLRPPPFLSPRRSPGLSRCRSGCRSLSGRGCRTGSRSLGRARGSRVPDVSSMARFRVPAPAQRGQQSTAGVPGRWPRPGAGPSPARTRAGRVTVPGPHLGARAAAGHRCGRACWVQGWRVVQLCSQASIL